MAAEIFSQRSPLIKRSISLAAVVAPWLSIAASIQLGGIDLLLAFNTPGYDAAGETISQMQAADAAYSAASRISLIAFCLLVIPFTIQLTSLPGLRRPWPYLMAFGFCVHVMIGFATAGFQSESRTIVFAPYTVNDLHDAMGHIMYVGAVTGVVGYVMAMGGPLAKRLATFSTIVAAIMILTGLMFVLRIATDYKGVEERIGFAAYLLWVGVVSVYLQRVRRADSRPQG